MREPQVVALHGDFADAQMMRRDVGIPGWHYWSWKTTPFPESLRSCEIVLVGYSRGGAAIPHVAELYGNVIGAVLYETALIPVKVNGKLTIRRSRPSGSYPVLWIENDRGIRTRSRRYRKTLDKSKALWKQGRIMMELQGSGTHIRTRPLGHGWDTDLNPQIVHWIGMVSDETHAIL